MLLSLVALMAILVLALLQWIDYQQQKSRLNLRYEEMAGLRDSLNSEFSKMGEPDRKIAELGPMLDGLLPEQVDTQALSRKIREQAESQGLSVLKIKILLESSNEGFRVLPFLVQAVGSLRALENAIQIWQTGSEPLHRVRLPKKSRLSPEMDIEVYYEVFLSAPLQAEFGACEVDMIMPEPESLNRNIFVFMDRGLQKTQKKQYYLVDEVERIAQKVTKRCLEEQELEAIRYKQQTVKELQQVLGNR